jgi:hypothetical protein
MKTRALAALAVLALGAAGGCGLREAPEVRAWRAAASELRGLAFKRRVPFASIERERIPELVLEELRALRDPEYVRDYRDAYAALGVLPRDLDLVRVFLDINREQLAGVYSVRRRTMYVVHQEGELDPTVVIHELVHALQHQHYPELLELMQGLRYSDDLVAALASSVEGDATLVMLLAGAGADRALARMRVDGFRRALLHDLEAPSGVMASAPRIVRESLVFPYAQGVALAHAHYAAQGAAGLDALLRSPPLSTRAALAPDVSAPVEMIGRAGPALPARPGERACRRGHDNVAGVLTLRVLFADHGRPGAFDALADEWRGDRFVHVDCAGTWELAWLLRWGSEQAARAFAREYGQLAASIAKTAGLGSEPRVRVDGPTTLVYTRALGGAARRWADSVEVRRYGDLREWLADDCFPESPCPLGRR